MNRLLALAAIIAISSAAFEADRVLSMPLWGEYTFKMYSGYLDVTGTEKKLHYIFVESQSKPDTDPLLMWFNGGPGCASIGGMMSEHGPYVIEDGDHTFTKNDWSWNKEANVLYLSQPAGVGYSICGNEDECWFSDTLTAEDNLAALNTFLEKKFPEYRKNDLYISGESYAGIYVPRLGNAIHDQNEAGQKEKINLKGLAVGNGLADYTYDTIPAFIDMGFYHGLMSLELRDKMEMENCDYNRFEERSQSGEISEDCIMMMQEYFASTRMADVNIYDIYGKCWLDKGEAEASRMKSVQIDGEWKFYRDGMTMMEYTSFLFPEWVAMMRDNPDPPAPDPAPCLFMAPLTKYMNKAEVRTALHIDSSLGGFEMCNFDVLLTYEKEYRGSKWVYEKLHGKGYKFLIFAGDTDGAVPSNGNQRWIRSLNWKRAMDWRAYYVDKQVAGYVEKFDELTFGTVHGAGHMAPQWRRPQNYRLMFNWMKGEEI